jgi:hypothetical protein
MSTTKTEIKKGSFSNSYRINAGIAGVLILLAYSMLAGGNPDERMLGMILEVVSGAAVIGIAFIMYPLFKPFNHRGSRWYITLRVIEGSMMIITGALFLSSNPQLVSVYERIWTGHAFIFIAGALIFYYLQYVSRLIPRWLSGWGLIASVLLLTGNLLELVHITPSMMLYLPIITNEIVLALWLIVKGFNKSAIMTTKGDELTNG